MTSKQDDILSSAPAKSSDAAKDIEQASRKSMVSNPLPQENHGPEPKTPNSAIPKINKDIAINRQSSEAIIMKPNTSYHSPSKLMN